jgi:hypothetical protein
MGGPEVPVGAGASAGDLTWLIAGIAALLLLAIALGYFFRGKGRSGGTSNSMRHTRTSPMMIGVASFSALALLAAALYFATDLFRSKDGGSVQGTTLAGWYTRQDLEDPSMGSAWYFDATSGIATYYAYWEPGSCDFSEPGSGPYSMVGGQLILNDVWQASLSDDGRQFTLDEPGQWSGEASEGVAGPNMTVMNGISGTYVASNACSAP